MNYTIDRFESGFAVAELERGQFVNKPRQAIPQEAKEGDTISVTVNQKATNNGN